MRVRQRINLENKIYDLFSLYRMIPLIIQLCESKKQSEVEEQLTVLLARYFSTEDIPRLKEWAMYTLYDMAHYFYSNTGNEKVPNWITEERMKHYHAAMYEQVACLKWNLQIFKVPAGNPPTHVLSVGCGLKPFEVLFNEANSKNLPQYIGIDKRYTGVANVNYMNAKNAADVITQYKADVVFFGNALHCLGDAYEVLKIAIQHMHVCGVIVIEYSPMSVQGLTFEHHLQLHSDHGTKITESQLQEVAASCNVKMRVERASSQHLAYIFDC